MKLLENVSSKKKWFVFFITYCGIIVWMTLLNRPVATRQYELRPFWAIQEIVSGNPEGFEDATLYLKNILLFVPFGFFLTVLFEG